MVARRTSPTIFAASREALPALTTRVQRAHIAQAIPIVLLAQAGHPSAIGLWLDGDTSPSDPVVGALQDLIVAVDRMLLAVQLEAQSTGVVFASPADVVEFIDGRLGGPRG